MKQFFVGIDVSKEKFDVAVLASGVKCLSAVYPNNLNGVKQLVTALKHFPEFELGNAVFCLEQTGIYVNHLLEGLHKREAIVWLENPVKIKQSNKLMRGKSDQIDAEMIAWYAFKNKDDLKRWQPKTAAFQRLKHLFTLRTRLISKKNSLLTPLKEADGFVSKQVLRLEKRLMKAAIQGITESLKHIEKEIAELIGQDENINHQFKLLTSVESIGKVTALYMILATNEFKDFNCPRKFACYSGVAPFEHRSGSSVRGKTRVSHYANKTIKSLLHLAAMSSIVHSKEMEHYYRRMVASGKNKMSVINAVRNKLIQRMFAVIRDNRPYEKRLPMDLVLP